MAARDRLKRLITDWKRLDQAIKNSKEGDGPEPSPTPEAGEVQEDLRRKRRRRHLAEEIFDIIVANPKLADDAAKMGFTHQHFDPANPPGDNPLVESPTPTPSPQSSSPPAQEGPTPAQGTNTGTQGPQSGTSPSQPSGSTATGTQGPQSGGGKGDDAVTQVAQEDKGLGKDEVEGKPNLRATARDNRLLGEKGTHYDLIRGPNGSYVVRYKYKIDGETVSVGLRIKRDELQKYGFKESEAKEFSKEQLKKVKNIGWVDMLAPHIRKGDANVFKSLTRYLRNQYGGQPILENDEVMATVIANSMFGWSTGEFENKLRQTNWYQRTNEYQRQWQTVTSPEEQKEALARTTQLVENALEDHYGLDWQKYVKPGSVKRIAEKVASGEWGTPDEGLAFWGEKQFDRAAGIEGTPAWMARQMEAEEARRFTNRPEDKFEELRSLTMSYLGQRNGKPLVDRDTLQTWATNIVAGVNSDGDFEQFLRQQMRHLHPYFDENLSFTEQASSYKSTAESVLGTDLTWDDKLLMKIANVDPDGKPTGTAMPLYDYEQWIRDNDPRFWDNPATTEKGRGFASELMSLMTGGN